MPTLYSKVSVEPTAEPITLKDAKTFLKVDNNDEDSLITILIQAARETIEQRTNRAMITQTRVMKMDYFPRWISAEGWSQITLPFAPVSSLTSIYYYDTTDANTLLSSSLYWTDFDSNIPRVIIKDSWPDTYNRPNAVAVTYVCGYGASGTSVPKPLIDSMYLVLGHLYENREQVGDVRYELPFGVDHLLSPYVLEHPVIY